MANIIEVKGVSKSFGSKKVLQKLDLEVPEGKIIGIIGASGSGKTTLLKLITGYYTPNEGNILYDSKEISKHMKLVKSHIGFATQENSFYSKLTVKENLEYFGTLYGLKKSIINKNISKILPLIDLEEAKDRPTENLSDGMQRRFDLACALINYPKVLIMDEPTEDLDPPLRRQVMKLIKDLNSVGTTIIITTHLLSEVEDLCDYIAVLHEGKIVKFGTIKSLRDIIGEGDEIHIVTESQKYKLLIPKLKKRVDSAEVVNGVLVLRTNHAEVMLKNLIDWFKRNGEKIVYADVKRPSLEEIFEELTKKK